MAKTIKITRVVGNRGRAYARKRNPDILSFNLLPAGNPGRRKGKMAKANRKRYNKRKPGSHRRRKSNPGRSRHHSVRHHRRNYGTRMNVRHYRRKRNPGTGSIGEIITTSTFVLVGALGSKLGAQLILGSNNTGVIGYAMNLGVGGVLWFVTDKVMKNKTAASGVIAGTVAQLILRLINDFTPFGQYVQGLGFGDYQMQSYVTPQILTNPTMNSDVSIPAGWGAPALPPATAAATTGGGRKGTSGLYSNFGGGGLY